MILLKCAVNYWLFTRINLVNLAEYIPFYDNCPKMVYLMDSLKLFDD